MQEIKKDGLFLLNTLLSGKMKAGKKYMLYYTLGVILLGAVFVYLLNKDKTQSYATKVQIDNNLSISNSNCNQTNFSSQSNILPHKSNEKIADKVWKKIQGVGFNSPKILVLLKKLHEANGEFKYYKELKDAAMDNKLPDKVTAYILYMLSTAFESNIQDIYTYGLTPKGEKDRVIQELILNQLKNPAGKKSYKIVLKNLGLVMLDEDAQAIYDELLQSDQKDISHKEIYQMKIKNVSLHGYPDSFISVIDRLEKNLDNFNNDEQRELLQEATQAGQTIPWRESQELRDRYIKFIKATMPKKLVNTYIDDEKIGEELLEKYDITESYYNSLSKKEQNKLRKKIEKEANNRINELTKENNYEQLQRSINALCSSSITREVDYYQACTELFLKSNNIDYKIMAFSEILNYEDWDEEKLSEYIRNNEKIQTELKKLLQEPTLDDRTRSIFSQYLKE